jgi:hypothetical protein
MALIDISKYNLEAKSVKQLAFLLYQTNNDSQLVNQLVSKFSLENLIKTKNNGLISNLLLYYISSEDNDKIEEIIRLGQIHNLSLMKRDYLNLAKYYYQYDKDISIKFFEKILSMVSSNTDSVIFPKDIDFIIENKMFELLSLTSGMFTQTTILGYPLIDGNDRALNLKTIGEDIISNINDCFEKILGAEVKNLKEFMGSRNKKFDVIIDGGNVIHARSGLVQPSSLNDLENIIGLVKTNIGNPLLVIHRRHIKTFPNLINRLNSLKINYYLTPYNMNDDIFILWFFLNLGSSPFIISNDKYRDHIFKFETSKKKITNEYALNQFHHILHQQTLGFDLISQTLDSIPTFSKCIQRQNGTIYVPHQSGKFIELFI